MDSDIYKEHILDHYKKPHNKEEMFEPDIRIPAKNASCGDSFILYLKLDGATIQRATFSGVGCCISQAAASLLTEKLTGMDVVDARSLTEEDIYAMLGIEITLGRQKCALLLFRGLEEALKSI